jgi:transcriptional regulator with XRE-family HTH domain
MNIGKAIATIRKKKGLTQKQFSEICEISPTSLSQIELGNKRPHPNNLGKICSALEIPEAFLYFLSFEEQDIPDTKKDIFRQMGPVLKTLIEQYMEEEKESL